jgi:hypothetical protein
VICFLFFHLKLHKLKEEDQKGVSKEFGLEIKKTLGGKLGLLLLVLGRKKRMRKFDLGINSVLM